MADSLVAQLDARLGFETFGIHDRFHLIRIENEHATFSPSSRYESAIFLDEATFVVETNLHALLHDLADQYQIICYCWYIQNIFYASLFAFFPEWDIADVLNAMCDVISRCRHVSST